jgi:hypothetical protein
VQTFKSGIGISKKKKNLFEKQSCLRLGFKESGNDSRKRVWKALLNETFLIV